MSKFMQFYINRTIGQVHKEEANGEEVVAATTADTKPVVTDNTEVEPELNQSEQMVEVANDTEKLVEDKAEAEEVVKEVEKDAEAAAEIAEKTPDQVEASDVVIATEMFNSKANRLGVKLSDLGITLNLESIKAHPSKELKDLSDKMKSFVKVARESIVHMEADIDTNMTYMWDVANEMSGLKPLTVHNEYNVLDWPKFFLGGTITSLWRKFVKGGETTIEAPGALVNLFLGKWTTLGDIFDYARNKPGLSPLALVGSGIKTASASKSHTGVAGSFRKKGQIARCENAYYVLVTNRKIEVDNPGKYLELVSNFNKAVSEIKSTVCKKCPKRNLAIGELNDLKLLRPDRIRPEIMDEFNKTVKECKGNENLIKKWEEVYNKLSSSALGILKYITDNLHAYDYTDGKSVKNQ